MHLRGDPNPQLQLLSSLQDVELVGCTLDPTGLGSFTTQLLGLNLAESSLLPNSQQGAANLLRALHHLTRLRSLQLDNVAFAESGVPPDQFSALTASSQHTQLSIRARGVRPLPWGAIQAATLAGAHHLL